MFEQLFANQVLVCGLTAWFIASVVKVPIDYLRTRQWDWSLWWEPGGMPSSHSALVTSTMLSTGIFYGFNTPIFAVAFALMMIVIYDAAGVRRQAGEHAKKINILINELLVGHPVSEAQLREVLGHTPLQVIAGSVLGLVVPLIAWVMWR
jgi:acid phosphatase family membrane protein YuiD